jgi:GxxExxY protein
LPDEQPNIAVNREACGVINTDQDSINREKRETHEKVIYADECYVIQGAVFEVYREMGCGFLEAVYQECLEKELRVRQVPFDAQKELVLTYKGETLSKIYQPDFICYGKIIVELKAVREIAPEHKAQLLNYLKATGLELGLLVNFGSYPKTEIVRIANTNFRDFRAFRG